MTRTVRAIYGVVSVAWLTRFVDYSTGDDYKAGFIQVDNLYTPLVWSIACLCMFFLFLFAAISGRYRAGIYAGLFGHAVFLMLASQIFQRSMLPYPWPPEDPRLVASNLVNGSICLILAASVWYRNRVHKEKLILKEQRE